MGDDDFRERFLQANANVGYMAATLAEMCRNVMRASASSDPSSQTHRAAENLKHLLELFDHADRITLYELLEQTIEQLAVEANEDAVDRAYVGAARSGLRFLVESSCQDGAAQGRASRRRSEFRQHIEDIEIAIERRREGVRPRR